VASPDWSDGRTLLFSCGLNVAQILFLLRSYGNVYQGYDGVALARYNDTSREVKGRFLQASIVSLVFPLTYRVPSFTSKSKLALILCG
jgi:hypothetical protein